MPRERLRSAANSINERQPACSMMSPVVPAMPMGPERRGWSGAAPWLPLTRTWISFFVITTASIIACQPLGIASQGGYDTVSVKGKRWRQPMGFPSASMSEHTVGGPTRMPVGPWPSGGPQRA